ncbi:PulE Type II secretory pathway, ATPase PulE/Tfp pilus assembly pathway, ATPase PilB [Burkholderiaceae bacterium]
MQPSFSGANTSTERSVIQPLDQILKQAVAQGASDIHFETGETEFRARYRIDGILHTAATPALPLRDAMISRLKVLARMDIAEKRVPQDGRIQYPYQGRLIDLRVSSLPTLHGEKMVVRLLNINRERPSLEALGYESDDQAKLLTAIAQPHGMVLMTGPTGSGKTLSLYSCLELLNRSEVNIYTVEDPSEIQLLGVNQVNINERAGVTFASTLRALLRQDPDIIMVGEIRDVETASIAIQAAQTGHLVLSTLHTNDAPSTLARLRHMGIEAFNVAASLILVVAQRLVRRLCPVCKHPASTSQTAAWLGQLSAQDQIAIGLASRPTPSLYQAVGCDACHQGYKGRVGIYQVMPISDALQTLILQNASSQDLGTQAGRDGVRTLRQAGWLKALQGITSVQEVMTLTHHG